MAKEQPKNGKLLEGNDLYEGYCADLAKKVAEFVKFDYIISPVKDEKYGQKDDKNSSWNGMVGELVRHVRSSGRWLGLYLFRQCKKFQITTRVGNRFEVSVPRR